MYKKTLSPLLAGILVFFCSCVDATYDLANKEIATDVEMKDNKLSLPLGSLQAFMLDSLLGDIDLIETEEDGTYCIRQSDTLYVEKHIHPIAIEIASRSVKVETTIPNLPAGNGSTPMMLSIPFPRMDNEVSFNNKIAKQFNRIYTCSFKKTSILLNLKIDGLEALQADATTIDLTIELPQFFCDLQSNDQGVIVENDRIIHITKEYLPKNREGLSIELLCSKFDFEKENPLGLVPQTAADGNTYLTYKGKVNTSGQLQIARKNTPITGDEKQKIGLSIDFAFTPINVQMVRGTFSDGFYQVSDGFDLELGDLSDVIEDVNNHITLAEPYIELVLNNTICVPIKKIELDIYGNDEEGNLIPETVIREDLNIHPAQYDMTTGEIKVDTAKYLLSSNENLTKEGFEKITTPNLQKWLEHIPDSIFYSAHPIIDGAVSTNILLDQTLSLSAAYNAVIPLGFEKLNISFRDTVPVTIDEPTDIISNIGLKLKMTVANTIPLGLVLETTALDENMNPIAGITFSPIEIAPCNEDHSTLQTTQNRNRVEIGVKCENNQAIEELKHIQFNIAFSTKDNMAYLKNTQGIQFSDIAIEISGDIKTNLNE